MSKISDLIARMKAAPKKDAGLGIVCLLGAVGMLVYWILYLCGVVGA